MGVLCDVGVFVWVIGWDVVVGRWGINLVEIDGLWCVDNVFVSDLYLII